VCYLFKTFGIYRPSSSSVCCLTIYEFLHCSIRLMHMAFGAFHSCIKCTPFFMQWNHSNWLLGRTVQQKNHFPLVKASLHDKMCLLMKLLTFRSWISFILHRFRKILKECVYKTNLRNKIFNEILNVTPKCCIRS